ncbi:MAG: Coq4 family protein [Pseudomonadota bacterium]
MRDARSLFLAANGLSPDRDTHTNWWNCRFGPLRLVFYNFAWRRRAIRHHDLHHIITGYRCTLAGEIQTAAWEFAAGRFPHWGATAFCLPLVLLGTVWQPKKTYAAFARGRRSRSLYGVPITERLLDSNVAVLRRRCLPQRESSGSATDKLAFGLLVAQAATIVLGPLLVVALVATTLSA